jgi:hypothetical protein
MPLLNMEIYEQEKARMTDTYPWLAKAHVIEIV